MKTTLVLVTNLIAASPCIGQTLGVYADSTCTSTCVEVPEFPVFNLYVAFQPGPQLTASLGFEFRLTDLPAHWVVLSLTPHPDANLVQGDPFDGVGTNLAFPTTRGDACLILYTIRVLAPLPPISNHDVEVLGRGGWCQFFCCPLGVDEGYSLVCLTPANAVINPTGGCTVGVERATWSRIKASYRSRETLR